MTPRSNSACKAWHDSVAAPGDGSMHTVQRYWLACSVRWQAMQGAVALHLKRLRVTVLNYSFAN